MSKLQSRLLLLCAALCGSLHAVDGVVLIDQNRVTTGNVTPGDAPGFPVTLSQPGSYRLSGNLTVPDSNTTAILITADNVTLDLNGFTIIGPVVCTGTPVVSCTPANGTGVGVSAVGRRSITVINGSVRGMGATGIELSQRSFGSYVERIHADSNGSTGISVTYGVVTGNTATSNGKLGFFVGFSPAGNPPSSLVFSGNYAMGNGLGGMEIACPSTVVGNTSTTNGNFGIFNSGAGCVSANNAPQ